jgi:uncharacterized protein YukJ
MSLTPGRIGRHISFPITSHNRRENHGHLQLLPAQRAPHPQPPGDRPDQDYQIQVSANGVMFRVGVNARSADGSEVEFLVRSRFEHPLTDAILAIEAALHSVKSAPGGIALDFIRGNLAQPWELNPLPLSAVGPDNNDQNEKLDVYVQRGMADERAMLYVFGAAWGHEPNKAAVEVPLAGWQRRENTLYIRVQTRFIDPIQLDIMLVTQLPIDLYIIRITHTLIHHPEHYRSGWTFTTIL